jgi:hypothetical protein
MRMQSFMESLEGEEQDRCLTYANKCQGVPSAKATWEGRSWGLQLRDLKTGVEEYLLRHRRSREFQVHPQGATSESQTLHVAIVLCQRVFMSVAPMCHIRTNIYMRIQEKIQWRYSLNKKLNNAGMYISIWSLQFVWTKYMWGKCSLETSLVHLT